ncbi:MAG: hypothetical protein ABSH14_03775 [Verrucomicrobiia bacterium]
MTHTHLFRFAAMALVFLISSCSGPTGNLTAINRDAASRCARNIDAWKQAVARLDVLQQDFDCVSGQIHDDYAKASAEEKTKLREKLGGIVAESDQTEKTADALFNEILRELEYVPRDKRVRAKLALVTTALKDAEGIRTPEVQHAMDAVHAQLQVLLGTN